MKIKESSFAVNPGRWRLFAAYHDGEEEPGRPSVDGQGGGWHYAQTFRSVWQSSKMAESIEGGEWGLPVRIRAERGNEDVTPIWLSLSPQNVTLETDAAGSLLAGLLPLTVQARLHKWNSVLAGVAFSLTGAPAGVSVNSSGVITVSAGAALNAVNNITVRASYQGEAYTAALSITKGASNYSGVPYYLGTVTALSLQSAGAAIVKGPAPGQVTARPKDYVLAVAAAGGRAAGSVFQWTGAAWEYRAPADHTDLYLRCYKDGLDVPELADNVEWFGSVIAGLLVAQRGFIQSNGFVPGADNGFRINWNGDVEFYNGKFRGHVEATNGIFHGRVEADEGIFKGSILSGPLMLVDETPASNTYTYNVGTGGRNIVETELSRKGITPVFSGGPSWSFDVTGTYSGQDIILIRFQVTGPSKSWSVRVTNVNGTETLIARQYETTGQAAQNSPLSSQLSFAYTSGGKTFKLIALPTQDPHVPGVVWRNGHQLMVS